MSSNLNLCPVCGIDPEDTKFAFPTDIVEHRFCRDTGEVDTDENGDPVWFVNIYEVDRVYGGPEEGGWYFDAGTLQGWWHASSLENAYELAEKLQDEPYKSTGDASSVVYSGGDYDFEITRGASGAESYPEERPFYE
jgi:hypothetical protein